MLGHGALSLSSWARGAEGVGHTGLLVTVDREEEGRPGRRGRAVQGWNVLGARQESI